MATLYDKDIDTKFFGSGSKDWIGIVLPFESQEQQIKGQGGYGFRRRVAIMGHHPSGQEIKDSNIVFALIKLSLTDGSGAANRSRKVRVYQGDVVVGVFLDDAKQHPMITGILGRTNPDTNIYGKGRFDIKSGFAPESSSKQLPLTSGPETTGDNPPCFALGITATPKNKRSNASEKLSKSGLPTSPKLDALPSPKVPLDVKSDDESFTEDEIQDAVAEERALEGTAVREESDEEQQAIDDSFELQ